MGCKLLRVKLEYTCDITNEPQTLRDEYFRPTKTLDAEYKPARLDDIIEICESLHIEEQYQLKLLIQ
jgi:hypothetical protein